MPEGDAPTKGQYAAAIILLLVLFVLGVLLVDYFDDGFGEDSWDDKRGSTCTTRLEHPDGSEHYEGELPQLQHKVRQVEHCS